MIAAVACSQLYRLPEKPTFGGFRALMPDAATFNAGAFDASKVHNRGLADI